MSPLEWRAGPNAHLLVGDLPAQPRFDGRPWEGTGVSIAAHTAMLMALVYAGAHAPQVLAPDSPMIRGRIVFSVPGHGDGIADGRAMPAPERASRAEPAQMPPRHIAATANPVDTVTPAISVPAVTAQPIRTLPGAPTDFDATSPGRGTGPGGGNGDGLGIGPGRGPGVGTGWPGDGDAFQPGNGVTTPQLLVEVKPQYTVDAMRAKLQGAVELEVVVLVDGSVDPRRIRITRSLDRAFGLDEQAIAAVRQWRFRPGTLKGRAVPVRVIIELTFTLR